MMCDLRTATTSTAVDSSSRTAARSAVVDSSPRMATRSIVEDSSPRTATTSAVVDSSPRTATTSAAVDTSPKTASGKPRTTTTKTAKVLGVLVMVMRVLAMFAMLAMSASAAAAPPAPSPPALEPYPWSWRMIISAVERRSRAGPEPPATAAAPPPARTTASAANQEEHSDEMPFQLIDNLPTVVKGAESASLLPQPERCDDCSVGTRPQPDGAGHVNSLVHRFEAEADGAGPQAALPGQFPWHVSLLYRDYFFACSGSLLSDEWVLTAANCAHGFDAILVRLGSYRPGLRDERFRTTMTCTEIVVHPGYRKGNPRDDIAVLRLPHPARLNGYILPVRLPSGNSFLTTYAGRTAWLSGWGVTSKLGKLAANASLGYVEETVLPNERCADTFGDAATSSTLCTTTSGFPSSIVGDSGAPLVVDEGGLFVQVGVLAFAPAEGFTSGGAAGFTRVTAYSRWIQNATGLAPGRDVGVGLD